MTNEPTRPIFTAAWNDYEAPQGKQQEASEWVEEKVEEFGRYTITIMDGNKILLHGHAEEVEDWLRTALLAAYAHGEKVGEERVMESFLKVFLKVVDMEIYALENTIEKSKELSVAVGHKRVYELIKLISGYKGRLEAYREIRKALTPNR